jgi:hypothetical protein
VVRVGERHVFQPGAQGGMHPRDYLDRPHTPTTDGESPEAEWGAEPGFTAAAADWGQAHGRTVVTLTLLGPQAAAHPVATVFRDWYRLRGQADDQLLAPTFIVGDPWRTLITGSVPFWAFFSVQPALAALEDHLSRSEPYAVVRLLLFQHGADSPGIARPEDWTAAIEKYGAGRRLPRPGHRQVPARHRLPRPLRPPPRLPSPRPPALVTLGREHGPDWPGRRRARTPGTAKAENATPVVSRGGDTRSPVKRA